MPTVARMAKQKKNQPAEISAGDAKADEQPDSSTEERVTEAVKLRKSFKQRLQLVADDAKLDMGILIEQVMSDYITREYRRVLQKRLEDLG